MSEIQHFTFADGSGDNPLSPDFETRVFEEKPDAQFWVGRLAIPGVIEAPEEYRSARLLRANVYIDEMGFLPQHARRRDGGEADAYDNASIHFGIVENMGEGIGKMRATSRLVLKSTAADTLPVEQLFPEAFDEAPAPINSAEVSRYIARHERRMTQRVLSLGLIRAMTAQTVMNGNEPVYAVCEEPMARQFRAIKLPYEQIADTKMLDEYNTLNMAIAINPTAVLNQTDPTVQASTLKDAFFNSAISDHGLGHYTDGTLMERL